MCLEITEFLDDNTVWDRWKEASVPQTSFIRPIVLTQCQPVTAGRTRVDGIHRASIALRYKAVYSDRRKKIARSILADDRDIIAE